MEKWEHFLYYRSWVSHFQNSGHIGYQSSDEQTYILKRQVHDNSSFNPFLMTLVITTEAARNKDAVLVAQRKADLWRHNYHCTSGTQLKLC